MIVTYGDVTESTRVDRKTLYPVWDEAFVYSPEVSKKSIENGEPWIEMKVYDWDAFSKDDFLGQARIRLDALDAMYGSKGVIDLPLAGVKRGKHEEVHGFIRVNVWFGRSPDLPPSLKPQLGLLGAPRVLHHQGHCMFEEPLFSVLCLKMRGVKENGTDSVQTDSVKSMVPMPIVRKRSSYVGCLICPISIEGWNQKVNNDLNCICYRFSFGSPAKHGSIVDIIDEEEDGTDADEDEHVFSSDDIEIGDFMYCKATLGRVEHTTHLVRQQNGMAPINDTLAFALSLPIFDNLVKIVVFRTRKTKNKGRATHIAEFSLREILPDLNNSNLEAERKVQIGLRSINSKAPKVTLFMSVAVTDMDYRRGFHGFSHLTNQDGHMFGFTADPRLISRFHMATKGFSKHDIEILAEKTATEYSEYRSHALRWEDMQDRAKLFVRGAAERGREKAHSWYDWALGRDHRTEEATTSDGQAQVDLLDVYEAISVPKPLGLFVLQLHSITIPRMANNNNNIYCVFKFDSFWSRTKLMKTDASGTASPMFSASFPILNPASVLSMVVISKQRLEKSKRHNQMNVVVVGKLKVRISTVRTTAPVNIDLSLLSERKKGGQVVGKVCFTFKQDYDSKKVRISGYKFPVYPKENYVHRVSSRMDQLKHERRGLIAEWLGSCNPPIPEAAINALEDIDREEFQMSLLKTNIRRLRLATAALLGAKKYYDLLASWKYPWLTRAAMAFAIFTAYHPLPVILCFIMYMTHLCLKYRPRQLGIPLDMEADDISMMEADDTEEKERVKGVQLEVETANPYTILKRKYNSVIGIVFKVQLATDILATFLERLIALGTWRDPLSTALLLTGACAVCLLLSLLGPRPIAAGILCFLIRPPRMRSPWTPAPIAFFQRLPSRGDRLA